MANGENEDLNPAEQEQRTGGRSGKNPLGTVENAANTVKNGAQTGQKVFNQTAQRQQKKALNQTGAKAAKTMAHSAKNVQRAEKLAQVASQAAKVAQTAAKLGKIIAMAGWIILLILAIIGLLVFILTGLGLIMSGLQDIADSFRKAMVSFIYGSEKFVADDDILDTLLYLEEMDYDLYGYGFSPVQDPLTEEKDDKGEPTGNKLLTYPSEEYHWNFWDAIDASQKYSNAYKYIRAYLVSDNYVYTVKHQNVTWNTILSPEKRDGMLAMYHEKNFGEKGRAYSKLDAGAITVNDQGELEIKEKQANIFTRSIMKYDLDGWTGRYGMPLEFLLSVHLATMAPDLSYKMATTFKTEVEILLHEVSGEINSAVAPKDAPDKKIEYSELAKINGEFIGDDWRLNTKEAKQMFDRYDGILESYTGDDYLEYKCSGPPDWSILQVEELFGGNVVITKDDINDAVTKIKQNNSKLTVNDDEEIENMIDDIFVSFGLNSNGQSSIRSTVRNKNTRIAAIVKSFKATVEKEMALIFKMRNGANLTFSVGDIGDITISIHDEDGTYTDADTSSENCERIADILITEINEKVKTANIDSESENNIIALIKTILNNPSLIQGDVGTETTFHYTEEKDESQDNNSQNDTDTPSNDTEVEDGIKEYYLDAKIGEEECFVKFVVEKIFLNREETEFLIRITGYYSQPKEGRSTYCSAPCPGDLTENNSKETCVNCAKYLKVIYDSLKITYDSNFDSYLPYVYRVKDHWFRDVYFTSYAIEEGRREKINEGEDFNIIKNDDDYEKKTGERWTLYETDSDGNYKLYAYFKNEDGNDYNTNLSDVQCIKAEKKGDGKYKLSPNGVTYVLAENGDGEYNLVPDRNVKEFRVGKKAIYNTELPGDGAYNAYAIGDVNPVWKQLESDATDKIKIANDLGMNIYYQEKFGAMKQVEDGVRGGTNPEIKSIFLDNYYLYDGTQERAALIQEAKRLTGGSDDPDDFYKKFSANQKIKATLNKTITSDDLSGVANSDVTSSGSTMVNKITENESSEYTATIDQISGPISLLHTSLSAFSILENMHTLDAEFIYHDFKELVVELNYFDKEDLIEAEDQVMMFPVAGVTSAGWPIGRYDKTEKYGTLIHSAEDLRALEKETEIELQDIIDTENGAPEEEDIGQAVETTQSETVTPANGGGDTSYANASELTDKQKMILQAAEDIHYYLEKNGYDYSLNSSELKDTLEESITTESKYVCCATFIGWTAQALGMQFEMSHGSLTVNENIASEVQGVQVINVSGVDDFRNKLEPGDVVWRTREEGQGHTQIFVGFDENGKFLWYNCGSSSSVQSAQPYESSWEIEKYEKIFRWTECELSYNGMKSGSSNTAEFNGFEGGETVVAPVSGELIAYGTTKRKNIEVTAAKKKDETDKVVKLKDKVEDVNDEVGFIKIRVLGNKESKITDTECKYFVKGGKKNVTGDIKDANPSEWLKEKYTEEELKYLGYDYFWEEYNDTGIGEYVLYIEGFEIPEEIGVSGKNSENNRKALASFISQLQNDDDDNLETELSNSYATQYTVPNLLDDKREFELEVAEAAKEMADYTVTVKDEEGKERIYIKEGAAIGRTYASDSSIVKEIEIKQPEGTEDLNNTTPTPADQENLDTTQEEAGAYKVGNYLRMIFRDVKDDIVENVEEYVEVGESSGSKEGIYEDLDNIDENSTDAEKIRAAVSYYVEEGFTVEAACGIMGNAICETTLNPKSGFPNNTYRGLFQWSSSRWAIITDWMRQNGYDDEGSFAGQIIAMYKSEDKKHMSDDRWEELKGLTDIDKATELFAVFHEGCYGSAGAYDGPTQWYSDVASRPIGTIYQCLKGRKQYAQNAYKIYMGDDTVGIEDGCPR